MWRQFKIKQIDLKLFSNRLYLNDDTIGGKYSIFQAELNVHG